jgi:hypothetical protein
MSTPTATGWLSRTDFTQSDSLNADDLNALALDIRTWGGNVNGGGYALTNVILPYGTARLQEVTLIAGSNNITCPFSPVPGDFLMLKIHTASTGLSLVTWDVIYANVTPNDIDPTPAKTNVYTFGCMSDGKLYCGGMVLGR